MASKKAKLVEPTGEDAAAVLKSLAEWYLTNGQLNEAAALESVASVFQLRGEQKLSTIVSKLSR
jgi:hypothetical protein